MTHIASDDQMLPINIIKKSGVYTTLESAEFQFTSTKTLCIFLNGAAQQRILIARKQGDTPRSWRSVDRAIDFVKTHFAIKTIKIKL